MHFLCTRATPTEIEIDKVAALVAKDSVGLVNMVDGNGFSPLILMCRSNRSGNLIRCIKALVKETGIEGCNVDVNYQERNGYTALHYICSHYQGDDFLEILDLLNQRGMNVNITEKECANNALGLLFRENKLTIGQKMVKIIESFIKFGIDFKHRSKYGWTALHDLCRYYKHPNLIEVVQLVINNSVDVTAIENDGWTALHFLCAYYGHDNLIGVAKLLIDNGVDVTAKLADGWTALHQLCQYYNHKNLIEIAKLMIESNGEVAAIRSNDGWTALHFLCQCYNHRNLFEVAKLLIDYGVDVTAKQPAGWNALHFVSRYYKHDNLIEVAKLLIENGVDVAAKNSNGCTALHFLCRHYNHANLIDIVELLIANGAGVQEKNRDEHTASDLLENLSSYNHGNKSEVLQVLNSGNQKTNT